MLFLKLLLIPPADFLWKHFGWDSRRISVFFEIQCKQMATKLLVLSKKKTFLEFFSFPKFVSYYRLFDAVTILFLLRIGQNCKRSTVIQICGRPQKNTGIRHLSFGTYRLADFQAVWHIADTHDERYVMHATNSKLSVKKQEWDMAQVEKTRILKQSHCTFV